MRYFEFTKPDYYALIAVRPSKADSMLKAMKIYVENVAYESVHEMRQHGDHPSEITRDQALLKYLIAPGSEDTAVGILSKQFEECVDSVLLIDQSLL